MLLARNRLRQRPDANIVAPDVEQRIAPFCLAAQRPDLLWLRRADSWVQGLRQRMYW